jgi:t-SNARE complex subunit (syntaxin)
LAIFDEGFIKMQQNKKILDELEIRKNEMYSLERAIQELHTLFVEMANLVEEQGDMVNRILDNVTNTEAYVEKAVEDVHAAARYQSSARRKKVWLFIFCLIGLAVVGLIIYLSMPAG